MKTVILMLALSFLTFGCASQNYHVNQTTMAPDHSSTRPDEPVTLIMSNILKAIKANDYNNFVADGNDKFRAKVTKQKVESLSNKFSVKMKNGYSTSYLDQLYQQGCKVYLWKLVYVTAGDDTLVKLVLRDGKVAGFWLK